MMSRSILAALLILTSAASAFAETNLDRAADICRDHVREVGTLWTATSTYQPGYAGDCAKVYALWRKTDTERNLDLIRRALADPQRKLPQPSLRTSDYYLNSPLIPAIPGGNQ